MPIQARGELPAAVQVLYPAGNSTPVSADEGTALLEEIHAVAPGANLVFCGPSTFVDFTILPDAAHQCRRHHPGG